MQPLLWNWWYVEVINDPSDSSTKASGGWQRLTIEHFSSALIFADGFESGNTSVWSSTN